MTDIIYYAIPLFILSLVVEILYFRHLKKHERYYNTRDTIGSLSMGLGNVVTGLISKGIVFGALVLVYHYHFFELDRRTWWYWIAIFFADDFSYYWFHRASHMVRYFWASHVVHHSSQYYNLGTALRQTWTGNISGAFIFYLWMPLVGFHPADVFLMQTISLIYQFWIHTEAINRLPKLLEYILNTPSHHRVHHGSDVKYLDKNHAGILIIWDRMFGTFQQELERPHYGLTKNLGGHNLFRIAFHEWYDIMKDISTAPDIKTAFGYIFGPPGWSHDGSRMTSRQLREKTENKSK